MRREGITRLSHFRTTKNDSYYLLWSAMNPALRRAEPFVHGRLLDVGCGNKPYVEMFPCVTNYIGCDIVQSSGHRVDVIASVACIPIASQSFDSVLCTQVIEHVADYQKTINEAYRVLKDNGHFVVSSNMYWPLHEEPHDYFRFTRYGFQYMLETAGFDVVEIIPNGGKWRLLGQVLLLTIAGGRLNRRPTRIAINSLFEWIDKKRYDETSTINYVAIAVRHTRAAQHG